MQRTERDEPKQSEGLTYEHEIGKWLKVPGFNAGGNFIPKFKSEGLDCSCCGGWLEKCVDCYGFVCKRCSCHFNLFNARRPGHA